MTRVVASAPGKVVVAGEYAVLEGAPALVMAVDRRARVVLWDAPDDECHLEFSAPGIPSVRCRLDRAGRVQWIDVDGADAGRLAVVAAVIEATAGNGAPAPFCAVLDTRSFFAVDGERTKLGLGSSAALAVALAGAISARNGRPTPSPGRLIEVHRRGQGGRGSGVDVAASLAGGLLVYRVEDDHPRIRPVAWPSGLEFCCVWSGRPASTGAFLRRLAAWREDASTRYASRMRELRISAEAAAAAAEANAAPALLDAVACYADGLAGLGAASGLDIVSPEHRTIAALAAASGVVYKPCGAGGGDIGIALALDAGRLRDFRGRIARTRFPVLDLALDTRGLQLRPPDSRSGAETARSTPNP